MKEKRHAIVNKNVTIEVNSSTKLVEALLVTCNEVMINKQNPIKLAAVGKIWEDNFLFI